MSLATPDEIVAALRDYRLSVVEFQGWRTRGTKHSFSPVGQIVHHDALADSVSDVASRTLLYLKGRPDLPPPLCNGSIESDGEVVLGAYGNANHAGQGEADVLALTRKGLPPAGDARLDPDKDFPVGNPHYWGWECRNAGDGKDPWEQLDAMERACAAMCDACGWPPAAVIGHREWTSRKIDPRGFDMFAYRADVARIQKAHQAPPPDPGDLMQLAPLEVQDGDCQEQADRWYKKYLGREPGPAEVKYVTDLLTDPNKTFAQAWAEWHATAATDPAYTI